MSLRELWGAFDAVAFFNKAVDFFFKNLILFVLLVLGIGLFRLLSEIWEILLASDLKEAFGFTVDSLLTFFIVLELFKSLVEYFRIRRLRLTFIVDAALVFIMREVMISLYHQQSSPLQLGALALMTLTLGCMRTLAIIYSPMEQRLVDHLSRSQIYRPKSPPRNSDTGPLELRKDMPPC